MKQVTLSEEQVKQLFPSLFVETAKTSSKITSELTKIQTKLKDSLTLVDALLSNEEVVKVKLTDELLIQYANEGLTAADIHRKTGIGYQTVAKKLKTLITEGKIGEIEKKKTKK
jgi:Fic family protein